MIYVIKKKAKIRNRYNQVSNLTQDNTWEVTIIQENITYSITVKLYEKLQMLSIRHLVRSHSTVQKIGSYM